MKLLAFTLSLFVSTSAMAFFCGPVPKAFSEPRPVQFTCAQDDLRYSVVIYPSDELLPPCSPPVEGRATVQISGADHKKLLTVELEKGAYTYEVDEKTSVVFVVPSLNLELTNCIFPPGGAVSIGN